jgi:uncharacterized membrane protein YgcG
MIKLKIEVPEARDRTAFATLLDGSRVVATARAVASASRALAAKHANPACDPLRPWGHPPLGRYSLINHEPAPRREISDYGEHLLLFQPESGPALDAESFGRLALLAFGGPARRRTQGGLRLSDEMIGILMRGVKAREEVTLEIVTWRPRAWWQFWKAAQVAPESLAPDNAKQRAGATSELKLLEALLKKSVLRPRDGVSDRDTDVDRTSHRESSSSASPESFQGKGGTGGGAGASGRWSDEAAGRSGVDSAGRILGAAAAIGTVATAAAMLTDSDSKGEHSGDGGGASSADSASTDSGTSTAY